MLSLCRELWLVHVSGGPLLIDLTAPGQSQLKTAKQRLAEGWLTKYLCMLNERLLTYYLYIITYGCTYIGFMTNSHIVQTM